MILFFDIETTGTDPEIDKILEIAAVACNDKLTVMGQFQSTIALNKNNFSQMFVSPGVLNMHLENGLWKECFESSTTLDSATCEFHKWLDSQALGGEIILAGNSIHFDRSFLAAQMKSIIPRLHYRQIDLTSLNLMAQRFNPELFEARPKDRKGHRALDDCYDSLETAKHYASFLIMKKF